jgi:hypothetical protein
MRVYRCTCQNVLFYDNTQCLKCGKELGFCPACRNLVALLPEEGYYRCGNPDCGAELLKCANYAEHKVCNRCVRREGAKAGAFCDCCRFNGTVPDQTVAGNWQKWYDLEAAKRRLFYDLALLGLPYGTAEDGIEPPLIFDFKADQLPAGTNIWRNVGQTSKVFTGHDNGRITINIQEADSTEREKLRVQMQETQRTLIGHFRHEIGHYYWDLLVKGRREDECKAVFGDHEKPTYADALKTYYAKGPAADWRLRFISAYASMHPWEDFAETWAMYLDMASALDTAHNVGFGGHPDPVHADVNKMIDRYRQLGLSLNEINRNFGMLDLVPEVFVAPVVEKLKYIHALVRVGRAENKAIGHDDGQIQAPPPEAKLVPAGAAAS